MTEESKKRMLVGLVAHVEFSVEQANERKQAFLTAMKRLTEPNAEGKVVFPNISQICRELQVPWYTLQGWKREDKDFLRAYEEILEAVDDAVVTKLSDATQSKWGVGYASTWLKFRGKLKETMDHTGTVTHIELVSNVRPVPELGKVNAN